jgi:hypothetical protein
MPNMMNSSSVERRISRRKHSKCGNPPERRQPFRTAAEVVQFNPQCAQFWASFNLKQEPFISPPSEAALHVRATSE